MIRSVNYYQIEILIRKESNFYYSIPKYQREYTWGQNQWRDLYNDINENEAGYFIGSIICINNPKDAFQVNPLEVVDGQQRLTTICLLLAAIYTKLKEHEEKIDEDDRDELISLKKSLICKESPSGLILCPQIQNYNLADFKCVMGESKLIDTKKEKNYGNRKIAKCYKYFLKCLEDDIKNSDNPVGTILEVKKKLSKAILVKIEVENHADAYTLFESLNNRGAPLTAIDLMKNLILANAEEKQLNSDECFEDWQTLLSYLTDNYATQERFFRHYYNAFKNRLNEPYRSSGSTKKDPLGSIATRSNLLAIFENLIKGDLAEFLADVIEAGRIYSHLILSSDEKTKFTDALMDLNRIQGSPSYLLLLYFFKNKAKLILSDESILNNIRLLTKFFVRRNITDVPNTRDLNRIFMDIISKIEETNLVGEGIDLFVRNELKKWSASDELFKAKLSGNIYEENVGVARFVLCDLAQRSMTRETWSDLWAKYEYKNNKKIFKWSIEHIFPEGKNIPDSWVNMIANGDRALANQYLDEYVHKIGNLTITAYNSSLSNLPFVDKRDRKKDNHYVGYKNSLEINKTLAEKDSWTISDIENRTKELVEKFLEIYKL